MRLFLFIFMISFTTAVAFAEPAGCYHRSYSERQLKANPGQVVESLTLELFRQENASDPTLYINLKLQVSGQNYETFLLCDDDGSGGLDCAVECDGGTAAVRYEDDGIVFFNEGITLEGACESTDPIWLAPGRKGANTFGLAPAPADTCR